MPVLNTDVPSPFAKRTPAPSPSTTLSIATTPSSGPDHRANHHPKAASVDAVIASISHEGARTTLENYRSELIKQNGEPAAYQKLSRILDFTKDKDGSFPWDKAKDPEASQREIVHKMLISGTIPIGCQANLETDLKKLNPTRFEELAIGTQLQEIRDGRTQRYKENQDRISEENQQKQYERQKSYVTGALSPRERAIAAKGLRFASEHAKDPGQRDNAARIISEIDRPINEALAARGPQSTYSVEKGVARRLASNPANVEAARDFQSSSPEYAALKSAAPDLVARNEMPLPDDMNTMENAARTRHESGLKKLEEIQKQRKALLDEYNQAEPGSPLKDKKSALYQSSNKFYKELTKCEREIITSLNNDRELISAVVDIKKNGGGAYNTQNHTLITKYNELLEDRSGINNSIKEHLTHIKKATNQFKIDRALATPLDKDFEEIKKLYVEYRNSFNDAEALIDIEQKIESEIKSKKLSTTNWKTIADRETNNASALDKEVYKKFKSDILSDVAA